MLHEMLSKDCAPLVQPSSSTIPSCLQLCCNSLPAWARWLHPRRYGQVPRRIRSAAVPLRGRISEGRRISFARHHYRRKAGSTRQDRPPVAQVALETDPQADANFFGPRQKALELTRKTWTASISTASSIPPSRCLRPMRRRPTRRTNQQRAAQQHRLGQYDRYSGDCGSRRFLLRWSSIWHGNVGPSLERWRPYRLGLLCTSKQLTIAGRRSSKWPTAECQIDVCESLSRPSGESACVGLRYRHPHSSTRRTQSSKGPSYHPKAGTPDGCRESFALSLPRGC